MAVPENATGYPEFSVVYALFSKKLSTRIMGILLAYLILSVAAIGLTLYSSRQLEGVAAAINDAGSLRMRSWKIAYQLARQPAETSARQAWASVVAQEMTGLEKVQAGLERGDAARPLLIPRGEGIPEDIHAIGSIWRMHMKPLADQVVATADPAGRMAAVAAFEQATTGFVADINGIVQKMEANYARNTRLLRGFQLMLVALVVVGIVTLMRFFLMTVIRPVHELQRGMRRMECEDLAARVPVLATDEFGDLSQGFNRMAGHLQQVYETLEERVESKTASLAEKNRELNILYDITRFLSEPMSVDELSQGFIERVRATFEAKAA
ncbi:MAG: HAMP domain-containing protein, partial [Zoogloea sp.]|nr:HAMP domain-containing protein [Zoogloea sp.]